MSSTATNINLTNHKNAIGLRNKYILFLILLFVITVVIFVYNIPQKITKFFTNNDKDVTSVVIWIICMFLIFSFISVMMIVVYTNESKGISVITNFKNSFLINFLKVLASIVFITFILWVVGKVIQNFNSTSIGGQIINILLIVGALSIIYKLLSLTNVLKTPIARIIIYSLFYIPCLLVNLVELIVHEAKITTKPIIILLVIEIILIILWFIYPIIINALYKKGGEQIINEPLSLNRENSISTYPHLNNSYEHTYQYAVSFWFYIDSAPPSTNGNYLKFTNILSYGNNPSVQYNASTNTLTVEAAPQDTETTISVVDVTHNLEKKIISTKDETEVTEIKKQISDVVNKVQYLPIIAEMNKNGRRIIYTNKNVLLQKWNNIILNYNGGTLDIFYNGDLVKSAVEVVPYIKYDTMIAGETNGLIGDIANVMYYKQPLDIHKIKHLYNYMKHKNPPCSN